MRVPLFVWDNRAISRSARFSDCHLFFSIPLQFAVFGGYCLAHLAAPLALLFARILYVTVAPRKWLAYVAGLAVPLAVFPYQALQPAGSLHDGLRLAAWLDGLRTHTRGLSEPSRLVIEAHCMTPAETLASFHEADAFVHAGDAEASVRWLQIGTILPWCYAARAILRCLRGAMSSSSAFAAAFGPKPSPSGLLTLKLNFRRSEAKSTAFCALVGTTFKATLLPASHRSPVSFQVHSTAQCCRTQHREMRVQTLRSKRDCFVKSRHGPLGFNTTVG